MIEIQEEEDRRQNARPLCCSVGLWVSTFYLHGQLYILYRPPGKYDFPSKVN